MAEPRFLLVAGRIQNGISVPSWGESAPARAPRDGETWFGWRLLASNNRELGRSGQTFPLLDGCRNSIGVLLSSVAAAKLGALVNQRTGLWAWRLEASGRVLAVSGRHYRRQREALYSASTFVLTAPLADMTVDVIPLTSVRTSRVASGRVMRAADLPRQRLVEPMSLS
jgi:hypothetical protein